MWATAKYRQRWKIALLFKWLSHCHAARSLNAPLCVESRRLGPKHAAAAVIDEQMGSRSTVVGTAVQPPLAQGYAGEEDAPLAVANRRTLLLVGAATVAG